MGSLTAPPGSPASSGAASAEALFMEARRRRRRRWLAGIAAALVAAAVLAISAGTWLPRAFDFGAGPTGAAGAALVGRSSGPAGHARFTYRVVTAGVPDGYGTEDVTFSGNNRSLSFSQHSVATGPEPAHVFSGTERLVGGQVYVLDRIHGRPTWVHEPFQVYANPKIIDPRRLLRVLAPYARFQASGYQVIGGVRLKVLRATDPGNLTRRNLLPVMSTSGLPVGSLTLWVDGQGVAHRMAFTFISYAKIASSKPVSAATLLGLSARTARTRAHDQQAQPLPRADRQADPPATDASRRAPRRAGVQPRLRGTARNPGDHDHGGLLLHRPAAAHHRPAERDFLSPGRKGDEQPPLTGQPRAARMVRGRRGRGGARPAACCAAPGWTRGGRPGSPRTR